jgi:hypothetical protein
LASWLVVSTPLKNISQIGSSSQLLGKIKKKFQTTNRLVSTLWLFNLAMENGPFIAGLPIKNGDFPWPC